MGLQGSSTTHASLAQANAACDADVDCVVGDNDLGGSPLLVVIVPTEFRVAQPV